MSKVLNWRKARAARKEQPASPEEEHASKASPGDVFAGLPEATSAWLGALGLTAGLAAAGFIGKLAVQQFLDIELGNWTALDLSIFAGRWAFETLRIILQGVVNHPFCWGVPVLLYLAPTVLSFTFPLDDKRGQAAARISIVFAALGLCFVLVWYEIPTLSMNDWLSKEVKLKLEPPVKGFLPWRVSEMGVTLLASKMDRVAQARLSPTPGGPSTLDVCGLTGNEIPDLLRAHLTTETPATEALEELGRMYATCVIICLTSLLALYLHQVVEETLLDDGFRAMRLTASFVLLPLVACLIPYMYGKVLYPSKFPLVSLVYTSGDPASTCAANSADVMNQDYLIVDETEKDISLLNTGVNPPYQVHIVDRGQIKLIVRKDNRDVMNDILLQCNWLPGMKGNGAGVAASSSSQGGQQ